MFEYYLGDIFFSYKLTGLNVLWKKKNVAKFYMRQKGSRRDSRHTAEFRKNRPE